MADLGLRPSPTVAGAGTNGARPLRRRRALPGGRAVVGGFLVALAAVGIFAGYTTATADAREPWLVARQDLPLGHRITRADLATLPIDLPGPLRARSYRDVGQLVGAVVIGPVAQGELIQSSDVLAGAGSDRQISFPVASARAVDGRLRKGEFVDVLATYGTGAEGYTVVVVRSARVADRHESRSSLAGSGDEVVTLAVPTAGDTLAVAHAVDAGTVTLVRAAAPAPTETAPAGASATPPTYTAPAPPAPGAG